MTYTPKNWVTGEVITEEALDHIEQGIANAGGLKILTLTHVEASGDQPSHYSTGVTVEQMFAMLDNGTIPAFFAPSALSGTRRLCYFGYSTTSAETGSQFNFFDISGNTWTLYQSAEDMDAELIYFTEIG